jgi:hypothetical protein
MILKNIYSNVNLIYFIPLYVKREKFFKSIRILSKGWFKINARNLIFEARLNV